MKVLLLFFLSCYQVSAADLALHYKGTTKAVLSVEAVKSKVTVREIKVWEPHEDKEATYIGFDFNALLSATYGESWKKEDEILFTCSDGYEPSIPVNRFLHHQAYLVYERKDSKFTLNDRFHNQDERDLSPFYLVWENIKDVETKAQGAAGWPWALVSLELIEFSQKFPHLSPPKKSSPSVTRGFLLFRERCLSCHSINGEGGSKGVELNAPHSVTEYFKPQFLRKWILDPSSIRANAAMPKFNRDTPDWNRNLNDIIEYLKVMAKTRPTVP